MSKTERAKFAFTVKKYYDGKPWIALEPYEGSIERFDNGLLGFDLSEGTDINQAKEIANYLNKNLTKLTLTTFD